MCSRSAGPQAPLLGMLLSPPSLVPISSSLGPQVCSGFWGPTHQAQAGEASHQPQATWLHHGSYSWGSGKGLRALVLKFQSHLCLFLAVGPQNMMSPLRLRPSGKCKEEPELSVWS